MMNTAKTIGIGLLGLAIGLAASQLFPKTVRIENDNGTYNAMGLDSKHYTFVNKNGLSRQQYADTMIHEACHEFVRSDPKHFCGAYP